MVSHELRPEQHQTGHIQQIMSADFTSFSSSYTASVVHKQKEEEKKQKIEKNNKIKFISKT